MKPSTPEIPINVKTKEDPPSLSFSHLSSWFASEDILNDHQSTPYGFSAAQEEDVYQTGYLLRAMLKC